MPRNRYYDIQISNIAPEASVSLFSYTKFVHAIRDMLELLHLALTPTTKQPFESMRAKTYSANYSTSKLQRIWLSLENLYAKVTWAQKQFLRFFESQVMEPKVTWVARSHELTDVKTGGEKEHGVEHDEHTQTHATQHDTIPVYSR
jgi:hypothetical protein